MTCPLIAASDYDLFRHRLMNLSLGRQTEIDTEMIEVFRFREKGLHVIGGGNDRSLIWLTLNIVYDYLLRGKRVMYANDNYTSAQFTNLWTIWPDKLRYNGAVLRQDDLVVLDGLRLSRSDYQDQIVYTNSRVDTVIATCPLKGMSNNERGNEFAVATAVLYEASTCSKIHNPSSDTFRLEHTKNRFNDLLICDGDIIPNTAAGPNMIVRSNRLQVLSSKS
jgi:hypothetical protein